MFDLFGSQVDTPLPALELESRPANRDDMLAWEKEVLGVYISEHPFKSAAHDLATYTSHNLADLTMELAGQVVNVAGLVQRVQARVTRDGRKFYVVALEDLSGTAELTIWSDVLEITGEAIWAEGQVLLVSVDCRERGDRLNLNVRKAAPYDMKEGAVVGFSADQWQVEQSRPRRGPPAGPRPPYNNGNGGTAASAATSEASRPGVQPPVNGDAARLVVTIYETEDDKADEALLKAVAGMLKESPGRDEVRLVIHDADGQEMEFDLPHAAVTEDLARSIRAVLRNNGHVRLTGPKVAA
jgi:DNA polymerase-3 subunit alpha